MHNVTLNGRLYAMYVRIYIKGCNVRTRTYRTLSL